MRNMDFSIYVPVEDGGDRGVVLDTDGGRELRGWLRFTVTAGIFDDTLAGDAEGVEIEFSHLGWNVVLRVADISTVAGWVRRAESGAIRDKRISIEGTAYISKKAGYGMRDRAYNIDGQYSQAADDVSAMVDYAIGEGAAIDQDGWTATIVEWDSDTGLPTAIWLTGASRPYEARTYFTRVYPVE